MMQNALPAMPTAHHIALAIVAACRATGEDPIECASGKLKMRSRHYAYTALRKLFPSLDGIALARMVGFGKKACKGPIAYYLRLAREGSGWDDSIVTRVCEQMSPSIEAYIAPPAPPDAPKPVLDPTALTEDERRYADGMPPTSRSVFERMPHDERARLMRAYVGQHGEYDPSRAPSARGRVLDHRLTGPVNLGDPAPGRSALDQRRAASAERPSVTLSRGAQ